MTSHSINKELISLATLNSTLGPGAIMCPRQSNTKEGRRLSKLQAIAARVSCSQFTLQLMGLSYSFNVRYVYAYKC